VVDLPGTRFGRYRIVRTLGKGAFSTVYEAVDEQIDSVVALKVLAENHALDPDVRERFLREAQLLRRIRSEHVVEVHDVGESDRRQPYIVMGHADGGDLRERMAALDGSGAGPGLAGGRDLTRGRYSPTAKDVLAVATALGTSLSRVHREGLVHRDVKPPNLLLTSIDEEDEQGSSRGNGLIGDHERLVLGDLGLAKDLSASSGLTVGAGTTGFAAPEQLLRSATVTPAADIYAASAVIFWMYQREPPGSEPSWHQIPRELQPVLRQGLAEEPDERQSTISGWLGEVANALGTGPTGPEAPRHTSHRRRTASLLALLIAVVLGVIGGYAWSESRSPASRTSTTTNGGDREVVVSGDQSELVVVGPAQVTAGEEAQLRATTDSGNVLTWFVPSGETSTGPDLTLTARRPGVAIITVVTGTEHDRALVAEFELEVTE